MENDKKIFQMMLEAAEDKATINAIRNVVESNDIYMSSKLDIIMVILGITPKKSGEPLC